MRLLLAVVVCSVTLGLGATSAAAVVPPSGFFGVGGWSYPTDQQAASLGSAGLRLVRGALGWGDVQTSANPSSRNWGYLDNLATNAANDDFNLIIDLNGCAVWACGTVLAPPTGAELTAYEGFVRAAVARYEPSSSFWAGKPRIPTITWQVWNEVNAGYFWPNPTPAAYAAFLGTISGAIRSVDPTASVIMSALTGLPGAGGSGGVDLQTFLQGLFQQPGFTQSTDAIVVHGYALNPAGSIQILDEARRIMLANNDAAQPMVVTEMSWASGGPASPFTVTPAQQAADLVDSWSTMLACRARWNLQHVLWFALQDENPAVFGTADYYGFNNGLLNVDGSPKPAYWDFLQFVGSQPLPNGEGDNCTLPGGTSLDSPAANGPQVTVVSVRHYTNNPHWQPVAFAASDAGQPVSGVQFQCSLDSGAWRACQSPFNAASGRQGDHTLKIRAIDPSSDATTPPASVTWVVVLTPPDTVVTSVRVRANGRFSAHFHGISPVGIASFQCRIGHRRWRACASPFRRRLHRGSHTFGVRAVDLAGNHDPSPAYVRFSVR
jgi:hypothetical protein